MSYIVYTPAEIKVIPIGALREFAKEIGVKGPTTLTKEELDAAVYARLLELEAERKVPNELVMPTTRNRVLNRMLVTEEDKDVFKPHSSKTLSVETEPFSGVFCAYQGNDGIISPKFVPSPEDIYVTQPFIDMYLIKSGDRVQGRFAASPFSKQNMLVRLEQINGRPAVEHRDKDISCYNRVVPHRDFAVESREFNIRAIDFSVAPKKGERIVLSHTSECSLSDFNRKFARTLKSQGYDVAALYLGVQRERMAEIESEGAYACPFDAEERYARAAVGLLTDMACRRVEDKRDVAVIVDRMEVCPDAELTKLLAGTACDIDVGSVTVFVSVNRDIMDKREYALLTSAADSVVSFTKSGENTVVDFKNTYVRSDREERSVLKCLRDMGPLALEKALGSCSTREELERIFG